MYLMLVSHQVTSAVLALALAVVLLSNVGNMTVEWLLTQLHCDLASSI